MADDLTLNAGSGGATLATDEVAGSRHIQLIKLVDGTTNATTVIAAGGGVEAGALRVTIASDSTGVLSVDDNGANLSIDDGGNSITVDNGGTFAVQVDGAALTALQLIDNVIKQDDAAFAPSTDYVAMIGAQADESSTDSVNEGDAGALRITLDRKLIVNDQPHTAGGCSVYSVVSAGAVISAAIKASAGTLYSIQFFNSDNANESFVRLYNMASAPANTDTPVWRGVVPGGAAGTATNFIFPHGIAFSTGIGIRVTGAIADNDTTVVTNYSIIGATYF